MFQKFTFLIIAFASLSLFGQETFIAFENILQQNDRNPSESYIIRNEETGNFAVFLDDDRIINGYLFNEQGKLLNSYSSQGIDSWYNEIIGFTTVGNEFRLYLKTSNNKRFGSILFNFNFSKSIETELPIKLRKDQYIQAHSVKDKLYIVTATKGKSILNLLTFAHNGSFSKKEYKLPKVKFETIYGSKASLHKLLQVSSSDSKMLDVIKVDPLSPNSIEISSALSKFYSRDNKIILTSDILRNSTILCELNIEDSTLTLKEIDKPKISKLDFIGNSFIYEDFIFLISSSKKEMIIEVRNVNTQELIKTWSFLEEDEIAIKNSPILQKGGDLSKEREKIIDDTKSFLRKVSSENIGISVFKKNEGYIFTIGGVKEVHGIKDALKITSIVAAPFATVGMGALSIGFNPTYFAYSSSANTKSIMFQSIMDENFNHVKGEVPVDCFEKIRAFSLTLKRPKAESIFRFDDYFLHGYYNSKTDTFSIHKFKK